MKINLRIITKNHAADPEIGFLKKSISKPYGRTTAMPTVWELNAAKFSVISTVRMFFFLTVLSHYILELIMQVFTINLSMFSNKSKNRIVYK